MTSPFLREICKRTGFTEEKLAPRWKRTLEHVAHLHGRLPEDLESEDYEEAKEYMIAEIEREIEDDPLNPDRFLSSDLDAESYLETTFVQDSPEGEEVYDDEKTHLIAPGEGKALQAAGLMAPGGAVGESVEEQGASDETGDLEVGDVITIISGDGPPKNGLEDLDDDLAKIAAGAAEEVLKRSPR